MILTTTPPFGLGYKPMDDDLLEKEVRKMARAKAKVKGLPCPLEPLKPYTPTLNVDYMDPDAMTTLLGDAICNIEEEKYWEACQHALKSPYELRANDEDEKGGVALSDDDDGSDNKSDSSSDSSSNDSRHDNNDRNNDNDVDYYDEDIEDDAEANRWSDTDSDQYRLINILKDAREEVGQPNDVDYDDYPYGRPSDWSCITDVSSSIECLVAFVTDKPTDMEIDKEATDYMDEDPVVLMLRGEETYWEPPAIVEAITELKNWAWKRAAHPMEDFVKKIKTIRCCYICTSLGFMTKELCDLHHVDELKNFAANIFLKLVCKPYIGICASDWLVTYWELCIEKERLSLQNMSNCVLG
ncbi:hypothetical protein SO802_002676 [Lithocarpus litseifolius]|uniref:Uncharacterized protein n=1 Tax=Lithocarpus litseifolius TaxID=425828 RepID=A0AAW2DXW6_9ROSI